MGSGSLQRQQRIRLAALPEVHYEYTLIAGQGPGTKRFIRIKDVENKGFMKFAAHHTWRSGLLVFDDEQGNLCISVVFTWDLPKARKYAEAMRHRRIRIGGPAVGLLPQFFEDLAHVQPGGSIPGMLQRWNPWATRTSLGCGRKCSFCGVPRVAAMEAMALSGKPIMPFEDWPDLPVIADDNLLMVRPASHFDRVLDRLEKHPWCDFNQGTDARLLTDHHVERFKRLKEPTIRLALDSLSYVDKWDEALEKLLRGKIPKRQIRTYAIMGFGTTPDQGWEICRHIEKRGIKPLPMWFHELDALERNIVTEKQAGYGWTDFKRRELFQWYYQHKKAVA